MSVDISERDDRVAQGLSMMMVMGRKKSLGAIKAASDRMSSSWPVQASNTTLTKSVTYRALCCGSSQNTQTRAQHNTAQHVSGEKIVAERPAFARHAAETNLPFAHPPKHRASTGHCLASPTVRFFFYSRANSSHQGTNKRGKVL